MTAKGLCGDGYFMKYGEILLAESTDDGNTYRADRFECESHAGYYDENCKSFRKAFLFTPLNHGIDCTAQIGTPVVPVGKETVAFSGRKAQYGKLVVIRHTNGRTTCYGHFSKIPKGIEKGVKEEKKGVIGYVGSTTGLASGPHLHYEMRIANRPVNPTGVKMYADEGGSGRSSATRFIAVVADGNSRFASTEAAPIASSRNRGAVPDLFPSDT